MGETDNLYFYDFGVLNVALGPKTNYLYLWRPWDTLNKSRISTKAHLNIFLLQISIFWKSPILAHFEKTGAEQPRRFV